MSARLESDGYMNVISRETWCSFCLKKRATYDVSAVYTNAGSAGGWIPSCGPCARKYRESLKIEDAARQERIKADWEWMNERFKEHAEFGGASGVGLVQPVEPDTQQVRDDGGEPVGAPERDG